MILDLTNSSVVLVGDGEFYENVEGVYLIPNDLIDELESMNDGIYCEIRAIRIQLDGLLAKYKRTYKIKALYDAPPGVQGLYGDERVDLRLRIMALRKNLVCITSVVENNPTRVTRIDALEISRTNGRT